MNILILISLLSKLREFDRRDRWTRRQLEAYQADAFRRLRDFVYTRSPFYQRFHRGLEKAPLHELPVLTKAMMMENFDEVVTDRSVRLADVERHLAALRGDERFLGRYWVNATSGSTGRRGLFLFDRAEWVTVLASFLRMYHRLRGPLFLPRRLKIASVVSPTPWHMSRRGGETLKAWWQPTLRLHAGDPLGTMVSRLNAWQPQILGAYPSILRALANEQLEGRLRISPRYFFAGAEVLTGDTRRRVAEAWNEGRLFDIYGATESGTIAAECVEQQGYHLFEDLVIPEVVDGDNRPVPAGVFGEKLLVTVLFGRTQPLIRYELSDNVRRVDRQCPCGRPFALIDGIQGRMEDILHLSAASGGTVPIDPVVFDQVMDKLPGGEWQVVQERDGLNILLCGTPEGFSDERLAEELRRALTAEGAAETSIRVLHVPTIPRSATGKAPLIKSNVTRMSADSNNHSEMNR